MSLSLTHPVLGRTEFRRGENRIPCHIPAAVFVGGETFSATCINISPGGFAIELDPDLPEMVKYTLTLAVNDEDYLVFDAAPKSNRVETHCDTPRRQLRFAVEQGIPGFDMLLERVQQEAAAFANAEPYTDLRQPYQRPSPESASGPPTAINIGKAVQKPIGRFGILAKTGSGLIGTSFHVRDQDGREYMLKIIHSKHLAYQQQQQAWLAYLAKLRNIQHDLFVPILEVGLLENKHLYLLSPYYPKGSLKDACEPIFRQGGTPHATHVRRWLATLTETLHYLHRQNLIHSNLKPQNLLIDSHNRLCLADPLPPLQLLAKDTRQALSAGNSSPFIAPIAELLPQRGRGLDIFGFGTLVEYLITGAVRGGQNPTVHLANIAGGNRIAAFVAACRRAPQAKNIPHEQLGLAFRNAFPHEEGNPVDEQHSVLFEDPLTVYQRSRNLIERNTENDTAAKRRLERLRVALGLARQQVEAADEPPPSAETTVSDCGAQRPKKTPPDDSNPPLTMNRTYRAPNGSFWLFDALGFPFKSLLHLVYHGLAMSAVLYSTGFILKMYLPMFASFHVISPGAKAGYTLVYAGVVSIMTGMFLLRSQAIVHGAVEGEAEWPNTDNPTTYWDIGPAPNLQFAAVLLICFGPFFLTFFAFLFQMFSGTEPKIAAETYDPILLATMIFGWFGIPWAMLSVFSYGSVSALNPIAWIKVYLRAALDYLILSGIYAFLFTAASYLFLSIITRHYSFLGLVAVTFLLVYLWFTCMRSVGIFHYRNKDLFFHYAPSPV